MTAEKPRLLIVDTAEGVRSLYPGLTDGNPEYDIRIFNSKNALDELAKEQFAGVVVHPKLSEGMLGEDFIKKARQVATEVPAIFVESPSEAETPKATNQLLKEVKRALSTRQQYPDTIVNGQGLASFHAPKNELN